MTPEEYRRFLRNGPGLGQDTLQKKPELLLEVEFPKLVVDAYALYVQNQGQSYWQEGQAASLLRKQKPAEDEDYSWEED